jgi:hypothetical protein
MKYFIGFPISWNCNLRCVYCFNQEFFNYIDKNIGQNKWRSERPFSLLEYRQWKETHLKNRKEIILHLFGGEPFCQENVQDVYHIIDFMDEEKIDLLSNGICDVQRLIDLKKYKDKIHRVGFTYHRELLRDKIHLTTQFNDNVMFVKDMGINVYVKELLRVQWRDEILKTKRYWLQNGITFKLQDFKGVDRGISHEEYLKYTPIDRALIDPEYKHGPICACLRGYTNLFIRGFDMADVWKLGGDIIACWHDPVVVGNIKENWYHAGYQIKNMRHGVEVQLVPKIYRGDHFHDLPI